jgi:hypothetical protein
MEVDMTSVRKLAVTGAITALLGVGALVATSTAASAYTVCNRYGDCWQVRGYDYPYRYGVGYYYDRDDWNWRHRGWRHHYWRHYDYDRGYWRNGVWIQF